MSFSNASELCAQGYQLVINEVMASNGSSIPDEDGDFEDWIELYNFGDEEVCLKDWGLSDDYDRPYRWVFPDQKIAPGQFLLVWASGKDRRDIAQALHTNFSISSSGEELLLTHPEGERVDELEARKIPRDISYGRYPDGSDQWFYFEEPTPGFSNSEPTYANLLQPPDFNYPSGFYEEEIELKIESPDSNVMLFYTTDGSDPLKKGIPYEGEILLTDRSDDPNFFSLIPTNFLSSHASRGWNPPAGPIRKAHVIRAVAVAEERKSAESAGTFFIFSGSSNVHELPVVSLVTDSVHLFGHDTGIYVPGVHYQAPDGGSGNFRKRGREWERPAWMSFIDRDGIEVLRQKVGLRIHGGFTRRFPQKSLRVYARNDYGKNTLNYPFFESDEYDTYRRLLLRNSGNDWNFSMFRDGTVQDIWEHVGMEGQRFAPSVVYINGEYWGIHHIRERQDRHYIARKFGLKDGEIDLLTRNAVVKEGDSLHFADLLEFMEESDLSLNENIEEVEARMDVDNFLDYYSLQIYCGNTDWPHNNIDYWRKRVAFDPDAPLGQDGRWRWLVYDLDRCLGYSSPQTNMIRWVTSPTGNNRGAWATFKIRTLLENEVFKNQFINRMADHLNSTFLTHRVQDFIEHNRSKIEGEMPDHIHRWRRPNSLGTWNNQVNSMNNFAELRPGILRNHIRSHFDISGEIDLRLDVSDIQAGVIQLNSLKITDQLAGIDGEAYPWTGVYFEDVPVKLNARPYSGHRFSHWEINGDPFNEKSIELAFIEDTEVLAVFEIDEDYEFFPEPFVYDGCAYVFNYWSPDEKEGNFPKHMAFVYMDEEDPGPDASVDSLTGGVYFLDNRTRINGLGSEGFSFINTGNRDGNPGYPGRQLGGAVLAVNTNIEKNLYLRWEAGTVIPNSRVYHLKLQYRVNEESDWVDFSESGGEPVEYIRSGHGGDSQIFGPLRFPEEVKGHRNLQLLWRYYYTGERLYEDSGARDELRIGHIVVSSDSSALELYDSEWFDPTFSVLKKPDCGDSALNAAIEFTEVVGVPPLEMTVGGKMEMIEVTTKIELEPGTHPYTLKDGLGCTRSGEIEFPYSSEINIELEGTDPVCRDTHNGWVEATFEGGRLPLLYEWSNGVKSESADYLVVWDFNGRVPHPSPLPLIGGGEALLIGGVTNPDFGSDGSGSSDTAAVNEAWQTTSYPEQGLSPRSAGVQFNISTEGYRDLVFTFDQRLSNTTANTWVLEYTADRTASAPVWKEAKLFRVPPQYTSTGDTWFNGRSFDFSETKELNDNPLAAFRIVSDFDPMTGQYESARLDREYEGGTSRWDMVRLFGNPINQSSIIENLEHGSYSIEVRDALGCLAADSVFLFLPDPLPVLEIEGNVDVGLLNTELYTVEYPQDSGVDLTWEVEGGQLDSLISIDSVLITWTGDPGEVAFVKLITTDENGCTESFFLEIHIGPVSVFETGEKSTTIDLFPNPNRGLFYLDINADKIELQNSELSVFNSVGKVVINKSLSEIEENGMYPIEIQNSGMYFVVLKKANGRILVERPVVVFK